MNNKLFVIWGGLSEDRPTITIRTPGNQQHEPDLSILNKSPCLCCDLFARGKICPYAGECSKLDEFQQMAAAHRTLYKPLDIRSMG
ncbi:MAG: hypothetical protein JRD47_03280 [Deltaproteobacteria bacterium]|nr:hypothetical protein [Deltaproteobacteria bacterium]MBW2600940.1 hypothetical protein [Deltaproteobacteria bacterium]OEU45798.1 MAG: hypothetical protein BBJ60_09330 [Desulfobacterales bacterium S7086C20]